MAASRKRQSVKTVMPKDPAVPTKKKVRDEWTTTMLERAQAAFAHDTEQRRKVVDDMKFAFVPGNQWDKHLTAKRRNRPCYEFNLTRQLVQRVTGQQLKNKPQIKVRAVEDNDVGTADVLNGLIKNIENQSSAETAYDTANQWATAGGFGILAVTSKYEGHDTFDQCLVIENVMNPMNYWPDPAARAFDRSDARYWFVDDTIPTEEYKKRWPKAAVVNFDAPGGLDEYEQDWIFRDTVRIATYWYIEPEKKTIRLLSDGCVVDAAEFDPIADELAAGMFTRADGTVEQVPPVTVKDSREVEVDCVYSCIVSGVGKLEKPSKWGGSMIPIVPQWGSLVDIDGKQHFCGMVRFGRDAATVHNFEMSTMIEVVAKLPNSPLTATPKMIAGLESYYERMGYDDAPVLLYNIDPTSPSAKPTREPPPALPNALAALSQMATDELKATLGVYDASLGAQSNETSGRAIIARDAQSDTTNYVYVDNQVKALKRLGEILVDAIPKYYDADRSIRILGDDNAEKYVRINQPTRDEQTGETYIKNDLSRGRYDVTVTVGKSFATSRMELAEAAQALSATPGPIGLLGQYMLLKSLDVPGTDEFITAARRVLIGQGLLEAGEKDKAPPPTPPNPKDIADADKAKADADKIRAQTDGIELDNAGKAAALQTFGLAVDANGPIGQPPAVAAPPGVPMVNGASPPMPPGFPG